MRAGNGRGDDGNQAAIGQFCGHTRASPSFPSRTVLELCNETEAGALPVRNFVSIFQRAEQFPMAVRTGSSPVTIALLVIAALVIGAGAMYIYNEQNREAVSLKLPGGEITVEKEN
jgi:hypothetical protein